MKRQWIIWIMIVDTIVFCGIVALVEFHSYSSARERLTEHGRVIAEALWNYNSRGAVEYLKLACESEGYEQITVTDEFGRIFQKVYSGSTDLTDRTLIALYLIPRVKLKASVVYDNGQTIGYIQAIWYCKTIYTYIYTLLLLALFSGIIYLILLLFQEKKQLEDRVKRRTRELQQNNERLEQEISERITTEKILKENHDKLMTVLDANPNPIILYDIQGHVEYFNPEFTHVFKWDLKQWQGQKIDAFFPDDKQSEIQFMIDTALKNQRIPSMETRRMTADGEIIPVLVNGALYTDREGNPGGIVVNIVDIREQKKLQKQKQQIEKLESISRLAGGIAHDFNNLMMAIQGYVSLMLIDVSSDHPHYSRLKRIEQQIQIGSEMTRRLLRFSANHLAAQTPTDINEMIRKVSERMERKHRNVQVYKQLSHELWQVKVNPKQMESALVNVMDNAMDATNENGQISIHTENVHLDNGNLPNTFNGKPGGFICVRISDNGIGMSPDILDRIYDPFFTTKQVGRGTGLFSTLGIVINHNGFMDVQSENGHGTTVSIFLPKAVTS